MVWVLLASFKKLPRKLPTGVATQPQIVKITTSKQTTLKTERTKMTKISNDSIERYRASLRATRARIDDELKRVHDKILEAYHADNRYHREFGRLLGERDQLALVSEDLKLLCEEFELFITNSL